MAEKIERGLREAIAIKRGEREAPRRRQVLITADVADVRSTAVVVESDRTVRAVPDDPADDRILECALAAGKEAESFLSVPKLP